MIKSLRILSFLSLLLLTTTSDLFAQKFGHVDSQKLIAELPSAKQVDKDLITFQKMLIAATDKLQVALDKKAKALEQEYEGGDLSKKAAEERYAVLQKEQEDIFKRRQEDEQKLIAKRNELFKPIFTKVEKAIQDIGKEQGYTFIFDASFYNAILFVEESNDLTEVVKKKLGL